MKPLASFLCALLCSPLASAQTFPILDKPTVSAFANELSGDMAKRNLDFITTQHRMRGSRQYRAAVDFIITQLKSYGVDTVTLEQLPADGKIFYGTQRSRPAWDADFAELWQLKPDGGKWVPDKKLADWDAVPLSLAQDSETGEAEADLIDVAAGTSEKDYAGKDVKGKYVLVSAQPGAAAELALAHGAVGLVSYAQNQPTAWSGDNSDQIRWGHLDTFAEHKTHAFMISLRQARFFQAELAKGQEVRLHGTVKAAQHPGTYDIVNARIIGADPSLKQEEIVYTCHLDHPRPGANDNASGCVTILEIARTMAKLIRENKVPRPARTLHFIWSMEVEGSMAVLNSHPEWAKNNVKANIHLDMVGGGPATHAVFHITRGPMSLPSFINDVAESIGEWVNDQTYKFASTGESEFPLIARDGTKDPLRADFATFTMGSDHEVYADSSWSIPTIYLNDWPDWNIHTNFDTAAMIDPTKLKRAAFIAGASGWVLATANRTQGEQLSKLVYARNLVRLSEVVKRRRSVAPNENLVPELASDDSIARFMDIHVTPPLVLQHSESSATGAAALIFRRKPEPKGPITSLFGYNYLQDHLGKEQYSGLKLLSYQSLWGAEDEYAYECLNFADGKRNVQEIRNALSAEYGPVPIEYVLQYLRALESIGVVEQVK